MNSIYLALFGLGCLLLGIFGGYELGLWKAPRLSDEELDAAWHQGYFTGTEEYRAGKHHVPLTVRWQDERGQQTMTLSREEGMVSRAIVLSRNPDETSPWLRSQLAVLSDWIEDQRKEVA